MSELEPVTDAEAAEWRRDCEYVSTRPEYAVHDAAPIVLRLLADRERLKAEVAALRDQIEILEEEVLSHDERQP